MIHKETSIPTLKTKKEIPVSNIDETPNKNRSIRWFTRLPVKIQENTISTQFYISHLGKENVISGLPWLERINPAVDWAEKTLKIIPEGIRKPTKQQAMEKALQIYRLDLERQKIKSKEAFAKELQSLPNKKTKKLTVPIKEMIDEDATPKFERLRITKEPFSLL